MSQSGEFVSAFRINGRPILPPVMTPKRKAEMQEYKLKALAIEKKLLEKKMMNDDGHKIKSELSKKETFTGRREDSVNDAFSTLNKSSEIERFNRKEEDKENDSFNMGSKSIDTSTSATKASKYPLSERTFLHSNNSNSELHTMLPKESPIMDDQPEDEAYSVVPTDSTDLRQYLDSTLGDLTPEVEGIFDPLENAHFTGSDQVEEEGLSRVSALLAVESKLAALRFSPVVDLSKNIPRLIEGKLDSHSNPLGETFSEKSVTVSVDTPKFEIECTPVPCLTITPIPNAEAKEVEKSSVPDSDAKNISLASKSEMQTVPSYMEGNSPKSPPMLVRRGSYTLDSPSPTLLANIHKYSVDDLPKNGIHSEVSLDIGQGKKVKATEKSASKGVIDDVEISKKTIKSDLDPVAKPKTSKMATKGRSVFERLAADAAKKVEARRKTAKEGTFKIPEIKKVPKSNKGLRSAVSINNIRASVSEAHKKRSSISTARRCNSDVNIPYAVVKAISSKNKPSATTQLLKKQSSVDSHEAPTHPQKSPSHKVAQVDAAAAQKRKRRRWSERWEGWNKVIEPIHKTASSNQASGEGEKVSADVEIEGSEPLKEAPRLSLDKSVASQNDHLTSEKVEEKEIDLCLSNFSEIEHINENMFIKVPENNVTLVIEKDLECHAENILVKEKKDNDNLLIAKQSTQALHSPIAIPEIHGNDIPSTDENEKKSVNDCHMRAPEVNVVPEICEERMLSNEFQVPEISQEVASNSKELLESSIAITESACTSDTSLDLSLKGSLGRNPINVGEPSSIRKIPLDLQHTIDSLPGTPIGRNSAKDMAVNILSRVVEQQDKAMRNFLEENRKREEDLQMKFQEQLKYLMGKLTRLLQAMPSPQTKDGSSVSKKSESEDVCTSSNEEKCLSSHSPVTKVNQSPSRPNCGKAASTPVPSTEEEISKNSPSTLPISKLVTSLSPSNYLSANSTIGVEYETSGTKENHDDTLKSPSGLEGFTNVSSSPQKSVKSFSSCSGDTSVHSSTLKDDLETMEVILNDEKSDTTEYLSLREKDATNSSQDLEQKNLSNKELYDSNAEVTLHDLKSSTAIEGCKAQNVDLDLSGILEMEYQGKDISNLPIQLLHYNPLHETCSSSLSSVTDSKAQMNYGFLIDELALHRKKYEEDVLRLDIAESTPRCQSKVSLSSETSMTPFSARKDEGMEECQISTKKSPTEHVTKLGIQSSIRSELPDLKSDTMALRTYLGAETPSTGPVTLETPLTTPAHVLEGRSESLINDRNEFAARVYLNVSRDETKEWNLSNIPKSNVQNLNAKGEENKEMDLVCDPLASMPANKLSPGRASEPVTGAKYSTPESCSSSVNYISAMSGSLACPSLGDEPEKKIGFSRLSALVKGYLTRRLLKTARVLGIKATIQDSMETALKLHSEISEETDVAAADVLLHGQILAQLSAASNELHHIFFELPVEEQMTIINYDRQRLQSRNCTPIIYDPIVAPSPRPALLSAVTLKTLQRRFADVKPAKNDTTAIPTKKKECVRSKEKSAVENNTKLNSRKLEESDYYPRPTRAKSFISSARLSVRKTVEVAKNAARKTVNGKNQPKGNIRKSRRSSSTGEINRRPWR